MSNSILIGIGGWGRRTSRRHNRSGLLLGPDYTRHQGESDVLLCSASPEAERLARSAHSRLDAEPRQHPRLKNNPKHDDGKRNQVPRLGESSRFVELPNDELGLRDWIADGAN